MVRIGVIGCGKIAQTRHLPEYAGNKDCKIIGVYDLNLKEHLKLPVNMMQQHILQ